MDNAQLPIISYLAILDSIKIKLDSRGSSRREASPLGRTAPTFITVLR
jgi:hypothetical protein